MDNIESVSDATEDVGYRMPDTVFEGDNFERPRFIVLAENGSNGLIRLSVNDTEKAALASLKVLATPGGVFHIVVSRLMNVRPRIEAAAPKVTLSGERARVRTPRAPKPEGSTAPKPTRKSKRTAS